MTGSLMERLDDIPKPAWIALLVVSFILFWPIGLALLIYLKWSGRMFCSDVATVIGPDPTAAKPAARRAKNGVPGSAAMAGATAAAMSPSTNIARRRFAGSTKNSASSATSSTGCAPPRTAPSSTSS